MQLIAFILFIPVLIVNLIVRYHYKDDNKMAYLMPIIASILLIFLPLVLFFGQFEASLAILILIFSANIFAALVAHAIWHCFHRLGRDKKSNN